MKKNNKKGFTIIELLVVITIIGILAAIVLSQTSSAKGKGSDATKRSSFRNLLNAGLLYYESNNSSYQGVCGDTTFKFNQIYSQTGATCANNTSGYRVRVQLQQTNAYSSNSGTDYLCTDQRGNVTVYDNDPTLTFVGNIPDCP